MNINDDIKRIENAIITTNEVVLEHIQTTKDIEDNVFKAEKRLIDQGGKLEVLKDLIFEQEQKIKRNHRFLLAEMILLWIFTLISAFEIAHLRG